MASRFFTTKDLNAFDVMAKELLNTVVAQECIVYKISATATETNIYGEASKGKIYENGVKVNALIDSEDFSWDTDEFGPICMLADVRPTRFALCPTVSLFLISHT